MPPSAERPGTDAYGFAAPTGSAPLPRSRRAVVRRAKLLDFTQRELRDRADADLRGLAPSGCRPRPMLARSLLAADPRSGKPGPALPPPAIAELFDDPATEGRLLLLGSTGSGKTAALAELASVLADRADRDPSQPVPVLLNLSTWAGEPLDVWIVQELRLRGIGPAVGAAWLEARQLLPLLDGLDEVAPEFRAACLAAIAEFVAEGRCDRLAVGGRVREYAAACQRGVAPLPVRRAAYLQPLTAEAIARSLQAAGCLTLLRDLAGNPALVELMRLPLFLHLMAIAAGPETEASAPVDRDRLDWDRWQALGSESARFRYLLDVCTGRLLADTGTGRPREPGSALPDPAASESSAGLASGLASDLASETPYDLARARWWLHVLAARLVAEGRSEFFLERLQPDWLPERSARIGYWLLLGLLAGGVAAAVGAAIGGWICGVAFGAIGALAFGLGTGPIEAVEGFDFAQFNGRNFLEALLGGAIAGSAIGLVAGGAFGALVGFGLDRAAEPWLALVWGLGGGLGGGLAVGLAFGLLSGAIFAFKSDLQIRTRPNQGILTAAEQILPVTLIVWPALALMYWAVGWGLEEFAGADRLGARELVLASFGTALAGGIFGGGVPAVQHGLLRLLLWQRGLVPWNYARFLDWASDRGVLQRLGGRYQFAHPLLRDYFARAAIAPGLSGSRSAAARPATVEPGVADPARVGAPAGNSPETSASDGDRAESPA